MAYKLTVLAVLTFTSVALALPNDHSLRSLSNRQAGQVPPQCEDSCIAANPLVDGTCTLDMCCTAEFEQNYIDCFTCVAAEINETDFTNFQNNLNTLKAQCDAEGLTIPQMTFPGQETNTATAVSSSPSSTSAPASSTASTTSLASVTRDTETTRPTSSAPASTESGQSSSTVSSDAPATSTDSSDSATELKGGLLGIGAVTGILSGLLFVL